jgi:hypothetical protein
MDFLEEDLLAEVNYLLHLDFQLDYLMLLHHLILQILLYNA